LVLRPWPEQEPYSRHFGTSRPTLTRWLTRFQPHHIKSLENRSTKPFQLRRPEWSSEDSIAVREQRRQYPRWGKKKLVVLLRRIGVFLSQSTVGRILRYLKRTGQIHEPTRHLKFQWRKSQRPWATRKPRDYGAEVPGDILQIDTVDLRPVPGVTLKQLSVVDVVSRWSGVEVAGRATARTTRDSLQRILARFPFPVRALQIDGGSEFMSEFDSE
jgi:transposase